MGKFTRLSAEQREDLVAYLDGELDQSNLETVESVLTENQVARHDLNQFSRTYELLNLLPRVAPQTDLTRRTLDRIEVRESQVWKKPGVSVSGIRRYFLAAIWLALLTAAGIAGYQSSVKLIPDPSDLLLKDLPVIQKLDRYSTVKDLEYLRELHRSKLFGTESGEKE